MSKMGQQNTNHILNTAEKGRAESIKAISLLGAFGAWVLTAACFIVALSDARYYSLTVICAILAISLHATNFLANRRRINLAIWFSLFITEIIFIAISFTIANLGVILAIILLIIISAIAIQSLPPKQALLASITGIAASIATLVVDTLSLNPNRIIPPDWLVVAEFVVIAGGVVILILGIQLLRYYQFHSLRTQIIVAFVIISIIPLWTVAIPLLIAINSTLQSEVYQTLSQSLAKSATEISEDFDQSLTSLKNQNISDTKLPILINFVQNNVGTEENILEYFQIMKTRESNILSYSLLDENGTNLVDTRPMQIGFDESSATDFKEVIQNQESAISEINFDQSSNRLVFYISSPIFNNASLVIGVLRMAVDANFLQREVEKEANLQGTDVAAVLIDENGIILANSLSPETRFKSISPLNQELLVTLQQRHILGAGTAENLSVRLSDLAKGLNQTSQTPFFYATLVPGRTSQINVVTQRNLENKTWKIIVGRPASLFVQTTNIQSRTTIFIFVTTIITLIALVTAAITSNLLTSPINYLTAMSERIRRGDSDLPPKLQRRDEIGKLSETLTATAAELRETLATFENRVEQQTAKLANSTEKSKLRAERLRSIAEISIAITSIQNLNELLAEITQQISAVLGFYHVGIFMIDQSGQYLILQASNSEGGQKILQKGYRLRVGQTGIVGFVAGSGQHQIALDIGEDATIFDNPDLPDTRSQIVLPLRNGENIIGVLDIQSSEASAFSSEDIDSFNILANQISIAVQNARLFEETRNALAEAQVFYRQSATASWREVLRHGTRGYRYLNGNIEAIKVVGDSSKKATAQVEKRETTNNSEFLTIPINIRGKSLGTLNIHQAGRKHSWSESEIHIYQSIVDRISFALENARLYQDAQRRASKERVISEIATKVSSSVNMDNILQTAVEELGRVLPGSEVVIQFEHQEDDNTNNP